MTCAAVRNFSCSYAETWHEFAVTHFGNLSIKPQSSSSSYPVSIHFFPRHRSWPDTPHSFRNRSHTFLHLVRSAAFSIFNPTFFTPFSTCLLHVILGRPRFRCPFTSIIIAFSILSSSLLITCPIVRTILLHSPLPFNVFFKPNISISFSIFFLSTNCTPHIDLAVALSVLLKITISLQSYKYINHKATNAHNAATLRSF